MKTMKRTMRHPLLLMALLPVAALLCWGCTADDGAGATAGGLSFSFDVEEQPWQSRTASITRAGETLTELKNNGLGMYVYGSYSRFDESESRIVENQKVTWNSGEERWTYGTTMIWPWNTVADDVEAYAYAPYEASPSGSTGITALSGKVGETPPAVTYTADSDVDLLWAKGTVSVDGTIRLPFHHALTKLTWGTLTNQTGYTVTLVSVDVTGDEGKLNTSGKLSMGDGSWTVLTSAEKSLSFLSGDLLLIPNAGGELPVQVTLTLNSDEYGTEKVTVPLTLKQGEHTTLNVTVGRNHEVIIEP